MQICQSDQPNAGQDQSVELTLEDAKNHVNDNRSLYENYSQSERVDELIKEFRNDIEVFNQERARIDHFRAALKKVYDDKGTQDNDYDRLIETLEYVEDEILPRAEATAMANQKSSLVDDSAPIQPKNDGRGTVKLEDDLNNQADTLSELTQTTLRLADLLSDTARSSLELKQYRDFASTTGGR